MNCPICMKRLRELVVDGVPIEVCHGSCCGVWIERRALAGRAQRGSTSAPLTSSQRKASAPSDRGRRECPRCRNGAVLLHKRCGASSTIEIDTCPGCGGCWLDAEEIAVDTTPGTANSARWLDALIDRIGALAAYHAPTTRA